MFIKVTKEQLRLFEEEVLTLIHKGNSIIEFASTPLLDKVIKINDLQRKELKNIIKKVNKINNTLEQIQDILTKLYPLSLLLANDSLLQT